MHSSPPCMGTGGLKNLTNYWMIPKVIRFTVADPLGLRRGVHCSIDLGETQRAEEKGMGGCSPLSLVGGLGDLPQEIFRKIRLNWCILE